LKGLSVDFPINFTPTDIDNIIAIACAAVFGAIIGIERQVREKPAGLRTNILICMGACVFTIISKTIAEGGDPSRIAAQIVTGIGFLGAGAIIRGDGSIHGLTSAAGIWIVAGIGMACGAGLYMLAITATLLTAIVLIIFTPITRMLKNKHKT